MDFLDPYRQALARNIKAIRMDKGISTEAAAMVLSMSRANYYKVENGTQSVKAEWLPPLAALFSTSIEELFSGQPNRKVAKLEQQLVSFCRQTDEDTLIYWIALLGIAYRNKLTFAHYKLVMEIMKEFRG